MYKAYIMQKNKNYLLFSSIIFFLASVFLLSALVVSVSSRPAYATRCSDPIKHSILHKDNVVSEVRDIMWHAGIIARAFGHSDIDIKHFLLAAIANIEIKNIKNEGNNSIPLFNFADGGVISLILHNAEIKEKFQNYLLKDTFDLTLNNAQQSVVMNPEGINPEDLITIHDGKVTIQLNKIPDNLSEMHRQYNQSLQNFIDGGKNAKEEEEIQERHNGGNPEFHIKLSPEHFLLAILKLKESSIRAFFFENMLEKPTWREAKFWISFLPWVDPREKAVNQLKSAFQQGINDIRGSEIGNNINDTAAYSLNVKFKEYNDTVNALSTPTDNPPIPSTTNYRNILKERYQGRPFPFSIDANLSIVEEMVNGLESGGNVVLKGPYGAGQQEKIDLLAVLIDIANDSNHQFYERARELIPEKLRNTIILQFVITDFSAGVGHFVNALEGKVVNLKEAIKNYLRRGMKIIFIIDDMSAFIRAGVEGMQEGQGLGSQLSGLITDRNGMQVIAIAHEHRYYIFENSPFANSFKKIVFDQLQKQKCEMLYLI